MKNGKRKRTTPGTRDMNLPVTFTRAATLQRAGDFRKAEKLYRQILEAAPNHPDTHNNLGSVYLSQGLLEKAIDEFYTTLEIAPGNPAAFKNLGVALQLPGNNKQPRLADDGNTLYLSWFHPIPNWGDALNRVLVEKISGKTVKWIHPSDKRVREKYIVLGSIMDYADSQTVIWGAGSISELHTPTGIPRDVRAVRGPLTRQVLRKQNIPCPEVYGDPALLYPRFYNPKIDKRYKIGIIPHYIDRDNPWLTYARSNGALLIDILGDINSVINQIKSCEQIASSSLHGIIAADAYGIPSTWIEMSDKVIGAGFKFRDYFMSVGRPCRDTVRISKDTRIDDIYTTAAGHEISIDLDLLFDACPFRPETGIHAPA